MATRREFLDAMAVGAAGVALAPAAKSYARILGSNERLNFAVIGLNSRGYAHLASIKANKCSARISYVCDVDSDILQKFADTTEREMGEPCGTEKDFRTVLDSHDVDAITIATPDHWHAPMAIAGLQAGKHVYLEKPCSHNPAEGRDAGRSAAKIWKARAARNATALVSAHYRIIQKIRDGIIGKPYFAKAWYINTRKSIGHGKEDSCACALRLESLAGASPASSLHRQCPSVQLALVSTSTAPASRSTTARTRSTFAGGRWASTIRTGSPRLADDITSRTIGSFTTLS